jgi:hypothetical protein
MDMHTQALLIGAAYWRAPNPNGATPHLDLHQEGAHGCRCGIVPPGEALLKDESEVVSVLLSQLQAGHRGRICQYVERIWSQSQRDGA